MMSNPLLELRNVSKSFGHLQILKDVNFTVSPGEVVGLLGDNGAGKSTLIKIISGFHRPTQGELLWDGKPVRFSDDNGPHQARELGIETVYQHLSLVNTMSIARNFFLGRERVKKRLGLTCLDSEKMNSIVEDHLTEMAIKRKLSPDMNISVLSGGEKQAVAIGRARYFGAKLLILDEPTSALSVRQSEQVLTHIKKAAEQGLGIIFITHTLSHLENVVDKVTVLFRGEKLGDFSPKEVNREQVANLITRGSM